MKNYILLFCLLFAVILVSCTNAGGETQTELETETVTEPIIFETADDLHNAIMACKPTWESETMISGTLIDLDFNGVPELLVLHHDGSYRRNLSIFKFTSTTAMEKIKTLENIYAETVFDEFRAVIPYEGSWIIPYAPTSDGYFDYYFSAFDFTTADISENILFNCRIYDLDYSREGYYGYQYLKTEFYIDGAEHKAAQDQLDAFMLELDEFVRIYDETEAEGKYAPHVPWGCGQFFPNPSQAEWEDLKQEFIEQVTAVNPAYDLFPNIDENTIWYGMDGLWVWDMPETVEPSIKKLTEAYINGDTAYFTTDKLTYNNGGAMCKPVIYLYPTEPTDVKVLVTFPNGGDFTCTYPDYGNGWNVTAYPDGTVINKADGLEYSYLYWEGQDNTEWDFSSGFVVKGSDTAAFLREKLDYLGLTPREYNEFIVYWLPLMQGNNYNLITFQTTLYEESALLYVSPQPDSMLRVFMAYKPLDTAIEIDEQELTSFERNGFSVIEWGGTCAED
jgi:hypothetical protein